MLPSSRHAQHRPSDPSNAFAWLCAALGVLGCSGEEYEPPRDPRVDELAAVHERVGRFIGDWGAAWHDVRPQMDSDPLGALDRWDAAISEIDARHFVRGASCGSQGAFSRTQADHDSETEEVLTCSLDGDRASCRTDAPHPSYPNERTHYVYTLARSTGGWRIAQLVEEPRELEPASASDELPALPPPPQAGPGPDYSSVAADAARAMFETGELARILLVPTEFGGDEEPANFVYVPHWVVEQKRRIDLNVIQPVRLEGRLQRYSATPVHHGTSAIPTALRIRAHDPGELESEIVIWFPPE